MENKLLEQEVESIYLCWHKFIQQVKFTLRQQLWNNRKGLPKKNKKENHYVTSYPNIPWFKTLMSAEYTTIEMGAFQH